MPELEIQGVGTIEVGDEFTKLSPQEQNDFVGNVISQIQSQKSTQDSGEQINAKEEPFTRKLLRGAGQFAMGIPQGLGNIAVGATQTVTDIVDPMSESQFSQGLARAIQQQNQRQQELPAAERAGIVAGEIAPFLPVGSGMGLVKGGALASGVSRALSPQEQSGLEERAKGTASATALGAGMGLAMKGVGLAADELLQTGKNVVKGLSARASDKLDDVALGIKNRSSDLYGKMREAGATLTPKATTKVVSSIDDAIKSSTKLNPRLHGDTLSVIDDLREAAKKGSLDLEELDQFRQLLSEVSFKNTDVIKGANSDARIANIAIKQLDNLIERSKPESLVGVKNKEGINLLTQAREEWKRFRKFQSISNIVKKADGDPNKLKSGLQRFLNNPKNLRGYSAIEKQTLKEAAANSTGEKLLKTFGKFGFDLGSSTTPGNTFLPAVTSLAGFGGLPGAPGAVVGGTIARQAQKLAAQGKVNDLLKVIEGTGFNAELASKTIFKLPKSKQAEALSQLINRAVAVQIGQSNPSLISGAQAADLEGMTEEEYKNSLLQQREQYPALMQGVDIEEATNKYEKRYRK